MSALVLKVVRNRVVLSVRRFRDNHRRAEVITFVAVSVLLDLGLLYAPSADGFYSEIFLLAMNLLTLISIVGDLIGYTGTSRPYRTIRQTVGWTVQIVVIYAGIYRTLIDRNPHAFTVHSLSTLDALYYSIYTFADFGTLTPVSSGAKFVVMSQMVFTFFTGTFVMSVLVSVFLRQRQDHNLLKQSNN